MNGNLITIAVCLTASALLQAQEPPLRVSPETQEQRLIHRVRPEYPNLAREAHIQGTVRLAAFIDESGRVGRLKLVSGHPFLVKAAMGAVKQWRYRPVMWNGVPRQVLTTISVTFTLGGVSRPRAPNLARALASVQEQEVLTALQKG